eukprot:gnl/MRDRNA2_/MRDRNA2_250458_c0_seq1.p1 gnl/MRDRNA2_/MRDRNA2_250458_c0~~gnl/MRDRNA2_/MRDRNA2_250458_c0_seq1.p1  ORF type:complete len:128 (-),score=7.19 gnl/MRDRNA2_/MRDRNA2_250458_c0_seq1:238-621(-)
MSLCTSASRGLVRRCSTSPAQAPCVSMMKALMGMECWWEDIAFWTTRTVQFYLQELSLRPSWPSCRNGQTLGTSSAITVNLSALVTNSLSPPSSYYQHSFLNTAELCLCKITGLNIIDVDLIFKLLC